MRSELLIKLCATFFYLGYFPMASGTFASFFGVLLVCFLQPYPVLYLLCFAFVTAAGFWASGKMEGIQGKKDPSCVVIDEVAGIFIAFWMLPLSWPVLVTAFFLYRAFDMFKIYPMSKIEEKGGAFGIMTDDLIAGFYTNLTMQIALRLIT